MFRPVHIALSTILIATFSAPLAAEEITMPNIQQDTEEFSIQLPGRGMSMETVLNRFGEPLEKYPAVGEPPITRWVYKDFTVYFESQFVIHAVVNN